MFHRFILIIGLMFLTGCVAHPSNHLRIYIDPSCPNEVAEEVISAAHQWRQAVQVSLDVSYGNCPIDPILWSTQENTNCIVYGDAGPVLGHTKLDEMNGSSKTWISNDSTYLQYRAQTILHEMGHALWLQHTKIPGDLMFPYPNCDANGNCNDHITLDDINQYNEMR